MVKFDPHVIPGFTLLKKLGVGSMSSVFLAEHPWLKRKVALKIREIGSEPTELILQERFRSGARIQAQLEHQHVVRVYDYLETKRFQVLVMQCVEGLTLAKHLEKYGPMAVPDLLKAINGVLDAVSSFHALGCIHRDIKPLNLMFSTQTKDANLLLTDFGVASDPLTVNLDMTVTGAHVGTLWYMPPEQLEAKEPTPSWDVFALGVTLYEAATGRLPLEERTQSAVFRRHLDKVNIPPFSDQLRRDYIEFCDIVECMLRVEERDRLSQLPILRSIFRDLAQRYGADIHHCTKLSSRHEMDIDAILKASSPKLRKRLEPLFHPLVAPSPTETVELISVSDAEDGSRSVEGLDSTLLTSPVYDDENE